MARKILVIEDDPGVRELLKVQIEQLACEPEFAVDGETGLQLALANDYSVLILDLNIPRLPGLEVCRELRKSKQDLPVIILSSKASELERVVGLELGADDYITKPFSIPEFVARLKIQLRRKAQLDERGPARPDKGTMLQFDTLQIDLQRRSVMVDGKVRSTTAKEFDLLAFLAQQPGRPFTREQLLDAIWGFNAEGYDRNVNSLITRLRRKVEPDPAKPRFIRTFRGVGYAFVDPADPEALAGLDEELEDGE